MGGRERGGVYLEDTIERGIERRIMIYFVPRNTDIKKRMIERPQWR